MEDVCLFGTKPRFVIVGELGTWPPLTPHFIPHLPQDLTVSGNLECYFEDPDFFRELIAESAMKPPATDTAIGRFMGVSRP